MNLLKILLLGTFMISGPILLTACEEQSPVEEAAEEAADEIDDHTSN